MAFGGKPSKVNRPGQPRVLQALCQSPRSLAELVAGTGLSRDEAAAAIETLEKHDVVYLTGDNCYAYTVELMRRWVEQTR